MIKEVFSEIIKFIKKYLFYNRCISKSHIKERSIKNFIRRLYDKVNKYIFVIWDTIFLIPAILIVFIVRSLRPFILIRFGPLQSRRIGHFATNTELYLCKRDIEKKEGKHSIDLFYCLYPICNKQLKKMWSRIIHIHPFVGYLFVVNENLPGGKKNSALPLYRNDREIHEFIDNTQPHISFTSEEIMIGNAALRKMGIPIGSSFICLHQRDSQYLNNYYRGNFYYHNYRNGNIQNCKLAVKELADRGYFVIRMGQNVEEEFEINNPRLIDYATHYRSDFLDIFLSAYCRFFIGCQCGLTSSAPVIFRKPIAWMNSIPLKYMPYWSRDYLLIPKKLWFRCERRFLTFSEILKSEVGGFAKTQQYDEAGIEVIENTPEEVLDLAIEMDERLKGTWQTTDEDEELQQSFRELFELSELHQTFLTRIGAKFLRQNRDLLKIKSSRLLISKI